jgi:hypothetical protein
VRARVAAFLVMIATSGGGCLATSDFDGIVGVRPAEGGPGDLDGGDAGADGATSICDEGEHVVCTTFDHGAPPLPVPGWNHDTRNGGTLTIDETSSVSAPGSLRARASGTAEAAAYLYRQIFVGQPTALVMTFDINVISCPAQGNSLTLAYVQLASQTAFAIAILSSGVFAAGSKAGLGTDAFFPLEKQFTPGTWAHVVLRGERRSATTMHLSVTVDNARGIETDATTTAWQEMALLNVGMLGASAPNTCEIAFDNFVLDRE